MGSAYYIAPEVLGQKVFDPKTGRKVKQDPNYNEKADVWSCGVILYILLSGVPPFWGDTQEAIFKEVLRGELDLSSHPWPEISEDAKNCIRRLLTRDPAARPSGEEMLSDPWLRKGGNASDRVIDNVVAQRLKQFAQMNKLKRRALQVIAASLDPAEIEGLRNMFEAIDTDKSGAITMDELRQAIGKGRYKLTETDITNLMQAADVDGNGEIDYEEFLAATIHQSKLEHEEHIYHAFKKFDKDGNGVLSVDEVTEALRNFNISADEVKSIIKARGAEGGRGGARALPPGAPPGSVTWASVFSPTRRFAGGGQGRERGDRLRGVPHHDARPGNGQAGAAPPQAADLLLRGMRAAVHSHQASPAIPRAPTMSHAREPSHWAIG